MAKGDLKLALEKRNRGEVMETGWGDQKGGVLRGSSLGLGL